MKQIGTKQSSENCAAHCYLQIVSQVTRHRCKQNRKMEQNIGFQKQDRRKSPTGDTAHTAVQVDALTTSPKPAESAKQCQASGCSLPLRCPHLTECFESGMACGAGVGHF